MLLDHVTSCGAKVFEQTSVKSFGFSATESSRPVTAEWLRAADGETGVISFDYLVDASGRSGLMSTKYLRNRHFNASLKNIALWGYWTGVGTYGTNTSREGAPWFEALRGTRRVVNGENTLIKPICTRRIRLGLAHSSARWNNFHRRRYESRHV